MPIFSPLLKPLLRPFFIALALCLSALPCAAEPSENTEAISKAEVIALLARVDKAIVNRDIKTIADALSDQVEISGHITSPSHTGSFKYNKTQYIEMLRSTWGLATNYSYHRSNQTITLNGNQAKVAAQVTERMLMQQKFISVKSQETSILKKEDGKLVAVKITVHGISK